MSSANLNFATNNVQYGTVPSSGVFFCPSYIGDGFGDSNKLVQSIQPYSLDMLNLLTLAGQTSAPLSDSLRIVVFQDLQANSGTPALNDLFEIAGSSPVVDFFNFDNDARFRIFYDQTIDVNAYGSLGSATIPTNRNWATSVDLTTADRIVYQYDHSTSSVHAASGQIYIMFSSYNGVLTLENTSRLWYKFL